MSPESASSSSSDWDAQSAMTAISAASTAIPIPRTKQHSQNPAEIRPYLIDFVTPDAATSELDIAYDLYSLFYPFTNKQSLLFSMIHPYVESDYKIGARSPFQSKSDVFPDEADEQQ